MPTGWWSRTRLTTMPANPCTALVTTPVLVRSSGGRAKKARKASDIPSSRNRGLCSGATSGIRVAPGLRPERALEDLAGDIDQAGPTAHGRLLDVAERLRLGHARPFHQHRLGSVHQSAGLELVLRADLRADPTLRHGLSGFGVDGPLLLA